MMAFLRQWQRLLTLLAACVILFLLWLPGVRIPITSDTTMYALLGESLWKHGSYVFNGVPNAKYLPLHAFLSYPLCWFAGFQLGMKISTLLAGCAVLVATYVLIGRSFSRSAALLTVLFLPPAVSRLSAVCLLEAPLRPSFGGVLGRDASGLRTSRSMARAQCPRLR
jgi:hypothetical protein